MTERDLSDDVRHALESLGLLGYHTYDSRKSEPGFPDWVITGRRGVLFRELKTETGRLTIHQVRWGEVLRAAGADYDVWRPSDWMSGRITRELKGIKYGQEEDRLAGPAPGTRSGEAGAQGAAPAGARGAEGPPQGEAAQDPALPGAAQVTASEPQVPGRPVTEDPGAKYGGDVKRPRPQPPDPEDEARAAFNALKKLEDRRDALRALADSLPPPPPSEELLSAEHRYRMEVGADIAQNLYDEFIADSQKILRRIHGEEYRIIYMEEAEELGIPADDPTIYIKRVSDGHLFEVELDVTVHEVRLSAEAGENGEPPS